MPRSPQTRSRRGWPMRPETITRRTTSAPRSVDREARSFVAVIATDRPVAGVRLDLDGLTIPDAVPVMLDHATGVMSTVGTVVRTWREGGSLLAELRLSSDPSLDPLLARIADGTIRGVSIGFRVTEWGARQ